MHIRFTSHGLERLLERTSLDEAGLSALFVDYQFTAIGYGKTKGVIHQLIYSQPDDDYFVIVLDGAAVITVLPLLYFEKMERRVAKRTLRAAKRLVVGDGRPAPKARVHLMVRYDDGSLRATSLGKFHTPDWDVMRADDGFMLKLSTAMRCTVGVAESVRVIHRDSICTYLLWGAE